MQLQERGLLWRSIFSPKGTILEIPLSAEPIDQWNIANDAHRLGTFYRVLQDRIEQGSCAQAFLVSQRDFTTVMRSYHQRVFGEIDDSMDFYIGDEVGAYNGITLPVERRRSIILIKKTAPRPNITRRHEVLHAMSQHRNEASGLRWGVNGENLNEVVTILLEFSERNQQIPLLPREEERGVLSLLTLLRRSDVEISLPLYVVSFLEAMDAVLPEKPITLHEIAFHYFKDRRKNYSGLIADWIGRVDLAKRQSTHKLLRSLVYPLEFQPQPA